MQSFSPSSARTPQPGGSRPASRARPVTNSTGRTQAQANANVIDALRTMLSLEPDNIPDHETAERVRITLAVARRQARDLRVRS
jgi:hypothetical protein